MSLQTIAFRYIKYVTTCQTGRARFIHGKEKLLNRFFLKYTLHHPISKFLFYQMLKVDFFIPNNFQKT